MFIGVDDEERTSESESDSDAQGESYSDIRDLNWFAFVERVHNMFKDTEIGSRKRYFRF